MQRLLRLVQGVMPTQRRALLATALAAVGAGSILRDIDPSVAKPKAKRRKRRRDAARERCLAACGPECPICYYSPAGNVICGSSFTIKGCPQCESDADCGGLRCVARQQARGGFRPMRFTTCHYPNGLCGEVVACAGG